MLNNDCRVIMLLPMIKAILQKNKKVFYDQPTVTH